MVTDLLTEVSPSQRTLFVPEMELCWNLNYVQPQYNHDFGLECIIDKIWRLLKGSFTIFLLVPEASEVDFVFLCEV